MESYMILAEAARHGVRAVAVRAVSDTADFDMPYDFDRARDARGQIRIGGVARASVAPAQRLPALLPSGARLPGRGAAAGRFSGCVRWDCLPTG